MYSAVDDPEGPGFPIGRFPDQSLLSTPRNLSQSATSFFASWRQGIHQMPLLRLIFSELSCAGRSPRWSTTSCLSRGRKIGPLLLHAHYHVLYDVKEKLSKGLPALWDDCLQDLVEVNGIEPMTSCLQSRRSPN